MPRPKIEAGAKRATRVAKRIQTALASVAEPAYADGVMPLNPGYFLLQSIRTAAVAKKRAKTRVQMSEKNV